MTVTELAKLTGFSISTVSKALSDSDEISAETKEKIVSVARETGYYQKTLRRKKRIGAPKTVGIVCDERVDFRRLRYLCRELEGRDIKTVITLCSEGETLLSDFLGVDVIVFFDTDEKPCSVPSVTWSGDIYSVAELLAGGDSEALDDFSTPQTKEDIWLF